MTRRNSSAITCSAVGGTFSPAPWITRSLVVVSNIQSSVGVALTGPFVARLLYSKAKDGLMRHNKGSIAPQ